MSFKLQFIFVEVYFKSELEVVKPNLQISADDSIYGASKIIWDFIMVKHMHS